MIQKTILGVILSFVISLTFCLSITPNAQASESKTPDEFKEIPLPEDFVPATEYVSGTIMQLIQAQKQGKDTLFVQQRNIQTQDGYIKLTIECLENQSEEVAKNINAYGKVSLVISDFVQIYIPLESLESKVQEISKTPGIRLIRLPYKPQMDDPIISEGVAQINAAIWQDSFSYTGTGVKVAILDTGFQNIGSLPAEDAPSIPLSNRNTLSFGQNNHGTNCLEVVYDIAPDADYYLAKYDDITEFYDAVTWCIQKGVDVISHSCSAGLYGPGDGTGSRCTYIANATNAGITWVQSAGNNADIHWLGPYNHCYSGYHSFSPSSDDPYNQFIAENGKELDIQMRWDDEWGSSENDYNIYLYDSSDNYLASSTTVQNGDDYPFEKITWVPSYTGSYKISIKGINDPDIKNIHLIVKNGSSLEYVNPYKSLSVPADSDYAITVGAISTTDWDVTDAIADFSSRGPTEDSRIKPDLVAPTNITTYTDGTFGGTSAATPHVAGAAILFMQRYTGNPNYDEPIEIKNALKNLATDVGSPGNDSTYGSGKISLPYYSLTTSASYLGKIVTPGEGTYYYLNPTYDVNLEAAPKSTQPYSEFVEWYDDPFDLPDDPDNPITTIDISGKMEVCARFVNDPAPPEAILLNISVPYNTTSTVDLSWEAPGDNGDQGKAEEYDIRYYTSSITENNWAYCTPVVNEPEPKLAGEQEAFQITGLNSDTLIYVGIKAIDNVGRESILLNCPSAIPDKISPQGSYLSVSDATSTSISLSWNTPGDDGYLGDEALEYQLRYSLEQITDGNWNQATLASNLPTPGTPYDPETYTKYALTPNTTYYFALKTKDEANNWSPISNSLAVATLPDTSPPNDPTNISSTTHSVEVWSNNNEINVQWTAAIDPGGSGLDGYSILWDTNGLTEAPNVKNIEENITSSISPILDDGDNHYFHIRPVDNAGNWGSTYHYGPFYIGMPKDLNISSSAGGYVTTPGEGIFQDYDYGEVVPITATSDMGSSFVNWTGDTDTIANPSSANTTITMYDDYSITANFALDTEYLTTSSTAGGSVTAPGESTYGYDYGDSVPITATPDAGYQFTDWTGDNSTIANPLSSNTTITMYDNYSITANFALNTEYLTTSSTAGGSVTTPGESTYGYDYGDSVPITATPDAGYQFTNWTGDNSTIANPLSSNTTITMYDDYSITANFALDTEYLTTSSTAGGSVTTPGESTYGYDYGDSIPITATPDVNYHFTSWTGDTTYIDNVNSANTTITMYDDYSITANFALDTEYLTTSSTAGGSVTTPGESTYGYDYSDSVPITATPDVGYQFTNWTGDNSTIANPLSSNTTITMYDNYSITANFEVPTFTISATINGTGGSLDVYPSTQIEYGDPVFVIITPDSNHYVESIIDNGEPMPPVNDYYTISNVTEDHTIVFTFKEFYRTITANVSGGHGYITPTSQDIEFHDNASINIYPDAGYHISTITDNGQQVEISNPYIITNVVQNHSIVVTFSDEFELVHPVYKITLDSTKIDDTLTHFPVMLHLSDNSGQNGQDLTAIFDEVGNNFKKIAVTSADKSTQLYVEVESWNATSEEAWLWVSSANWSVSNSADTMIYLYCDNDMPDNDDYVGIVASAPGHAVWDPNYSLVDHMGDYLDNSHIKDSTAIGYTGTKASANNPVENDGLIGKAQEFDLTDDYINFGDILDIHTNDMTIEAFVNPDSLTPANNNYLVAKADNSATNGRYGFAAPSTTANTSSAYLDPDSSVVVNSSDPMTSGWNYVCSMYDRDGNLSLQVNTLKTTGSSIASGVGLDLNTSYDLLFGGYTISDVNTPRYDGLIDEVRISDIVRSDAWLDASYYAITDNLVSYADVLIAKTSLTKEKAGDSIIVVPVNIDMVVQNMTGENQTSLVIDSYSANATYSYAPPDGIQMLDVRPGDSPFNNTSDTIANNNPGDDWTQIWEDSANGSNPNITLARLVPILIGSCLDTTTLDLAFTSIISSDGENIIQDTTATQILQRGDADGNGIVNSLDADWIGHFVVGNITLNDIQGLNAASVRHDGVSGDKINIYDSMFIGQYLAGQRDDYFETIVAKSSALPTMTDTGTITVEAGTYTLTEDQYYAIPIVVNDIPETGAGLGGYVLQVTYPKTMSIVDVRAGDKQFKNTPVYNDLEEQSIIQLTGWHPYSDATGDVIVAYLIVKSDDAKFNPSKLNIKVLELIDSMGNPMSVKDTGKEALTKDSLSK